MTQPRRGIGTTIVVVAVIIVLVVATMAFVVLSLQTSTPPHGTSSNTSSASTNSIAPPQCSAPCAVWTRAGGSNPEYVAISPNDSFVVAAVAIANGSEIYALDNNGSTLWSHDLDHQISSIAISANGMYVVAGGWQSSGGLARSFDNGEVYLFSSGGKLLWSVNAGSSNPVFKVAISADGSKLAVDGEESMMYLSGADGSTIWSYHTGGNVAGMGMSLDGSLVVASMGPIVAFNGQGATLWSHPAQDLAVSVNSVAISPDGSRIWVGSAVDGSNGTLYLFNRQGSLLWQHQIFSPALSIQTGANATAFVSTNFGALLYGGDGSLLKNMTSSAAAAIAGGCNPLPSFWYWSTNEDPVAFLDTHGNIVSSYNPGGFTVNGALSSDGSYAAVVSTIGLSSNYSLAFVYLGQPNQSCLQTTTTLSSSTGIATASVSNSSDGLNLNLQVNAGGNGTFTVTAYESNLLSSVNNVTEANQWKYPVDLLNPANNCAPTNNPVGFAIFQGYYGMSNYTSGKALPLYNTNVEFHCTENIYPNEYVFQPLSDSISVYNHGQFETNGTASLSLLTGGYWTGGAGTPTSASFSEFRGVYTVLAADEWGNVLLLHFTVV